MVEATNYFETAEKLGIELDCIRKIARHKKEVIICIHSLAMIFLWYM